MPPTEEAVWQALARVSDPEYPMSVVDLGLVYSVVVAGPEIRLELTFTSIGCPAIDMMIDDIRSELHQLPGVERVAIEVVWDPPWTKEKISERGRRVLVAHGVVA